MINTNGLEFLRGDDLAAGLAARRQGLQLFLQLDGLDAASHVALRGSDLLARKQAVIETIVRHDLPTNLACTIVRGVNEDQVGELLKLGLNTPQIRGITFQPATWSGRFEHAMDPLERVTLADVIRLLAQQSGGLLDRRRLSPAALLASQLLQLHVSSRGAGRASRWRSVESPGTKITWSDSRIV